jgi:hypothetical protein
MNVAQTVLFLLGAAAVCGTFYAIVLSFSPTIFRPHILSWSAINVVAAIVWISSACCTAKPSRKCFVIEVIIYSEYVLFQIFYLALGAYLIFSHFEIEFNSPPVICFLVSWSICLANLPVLSALLILKICNRSNKHNAINEKPVNDEANNDEPITEHNREALAEVNRMTSSKPSLSYGPDFFDLIDLKNNVEKNDIPPA